MTDNDQPLLAHHEPDTEPDQPPPPTAVFAGSLHVKVAPSIRRWFLALIALWAVVIGVVVWLLVH